MNWILRGALVSDKVLLGAATAVEREFLVHQKGFVKREILKGANGKWADIVYWESEEDANKATAAAYKSDICFVYFALMKGADHAEVSEVQHFTVLDL